LTKALTGCDGAAGVGGGLPRCVSPPEFPELAVVPAPFPVAPFPIIARFMELPAEPEVRVAELCGDRVTG